MAKVRCSVVLCMVLALTLVLQEVAECSSNGLSVELLHRKFLMEKMNLEKDLKSKAASEFTKNAKNEMTEDWELRGVPAGPDPLHHNGQNPNKPRTP